MNDEPKKSEDYTYAIYCVIKSHCPEFKSSDLSDIIYFFTEYKKCKDDERVKAHAILRAIEFMAHNSQTFDKCHFHTLSTLVDDLNSYNHSTPDPKPFGECQCW